MCDNSFKPLRLSDMQLYKCYADRRPCRTAESSFVCTFIWNHKYKHMILPTENALYIRFVIDGRHYVKALGVRDWSVALKELRQIAPDAALHYLTEWDYERITELRDLPFTMVEIRESADYLYLREALVKLEGKKYHSKRNFCSRFKREYERRWSYETINADNICDVWKFHEAWCRKNGCCSSVTLREEADAIAVLLEEIDRMSVMSGVLKLDGRVVAFTCGSMVAEDTLEIHVEKADYDVIGAYQMIFREFISRSEALYVSREDDMGIENLRKSKMSYHPEMVLTKYTTIQKK